ncbi:NDP-hexose 2,3-dehydratase family protein [Streptomyces sp. BHT-5-2]|uniref:NDP-hexose 2,3-dehydratase family protein n=1 Tax=Streptomyces sp. BHT-5-2 TaxID=2866715 RepID=UPI001C8E0E4B|nr:NDP-hexose 2,3-dehydratase family protein [Streptomyces sp. BHT-5-2]QZL06400.1 NDP-hexose 2,3-dehydratase family protein [Streptomyces sp. BHT-5-2]
MSTPEPQRPDPAPSPLPGFRHWLDEQRRGDTHRVQRIPLDRMTKWRTDARTGNLQHESGRFFTIEGLEVSHRDGLTARWTQPVIHQPEVGLLGLLTRQFAGEPYFLVQAKTEPGNCNGVQLSPTVQATRSNFTGVHGGSAVPYLDHFLRAGPRDVLVDVLQSEHGAWCFRKRNRNMVVRVSGSCEAADGFRWLSLAELHRLLREDDLVQMDTRSVLACLLSCGLAPTGRGLHTTGEVLHRITRYRAEGAVRSRLVPLAAVGGWQRDGWSLSPAAGTGGFDVVGVDVTAPGREVAAWRQPMVAPRGTGLAAFVIRRFNGVLHALARVGVEPGSPDLAELSPTVQCFPVEDEMGSAAEKQPPFLRDVLAASPERIRFDTVLSEEGGRFLHARTRHLVVEADERWPLEEPAGFVWVTLAQLGELLRHSNYVNVQARSLAACLHSLTVNAADGTVRTGAGGH